MLKVMKISGFQISHFHHSNIQTVTIKFIQTDHSIFATKGLYVCTTFVRPPYYLYPSRTQPPFPERFVYTKFYFEQFSSQKVRHSQALI
jgi:hypothetical protein